MRRPNQGEQLIKLSKEVTELQFKLSLALLKLEHRLPQPQQPTNDNEADELVARSPLAPSKVPSSPSVNMWAAPINTHLSH